jgi:hypothetical protein
MLLSNTYITNFYIDLFYKFYFCLLGISFASFIYMTVRAAPSPAP